MVFQQSVYQKKFVSLKIAITADPELPVPPVLYGGIERIIAMLIEGLVNLGHEVVLFAHKDSVVPCQLIPYAAADNRLKSVVINTIIINKALLLQKFDIIHSFGRMAYLLPQMPLNIPILMSYQREPTVSPIKRAVSLSLKNTMSFTGCSDYITAKIQPFAIANTIHNCVDMSKYSLLTKASEDAPLVFLGRIEPIKGTHNAIEIAIKARRKLIIAGNIPIEQADYFKNRIKPFLDDQITYIGAVNDHQKNELLGKALALLMPIEWDEPFGIVMIEAMACGTPVLGLNKGAVPEVIEQGITGYYADNIEDLIKKVGQIESLDRTKIKSITHDRFSKEVVVKQYISLYQKMIGSK